MADNFLAEVNPTGQNFVYATYLGNVVQSGSTSSVGLQGNVAVVAGTWGSGAPPLVTTQGAVQTTAPPSGTGGFISKYVFLQGAGAYISNINPNVGSNTSAVSVTLNGGGFESGATVSLVGSGGTVQAQLVQVSTDGRSITGTFDLRGEGTGPADVVVTNPDTTTATLPQGFTVQATNSQQMYSQVLGPGRQRLGGGMVYTVLYGNNGNTDQFAVPFFITFDSSFTYKVLSPIATLDDSTSGGHLDFSQDPLEYNDGAGHTVLELLIPVIRAGTTSAVQLLLTAPAGEQYLLQNYTIQSQLYPAILEVGPVGATTSGLRVTPTTVVASLAAAPSLFGKQGEPAFVRDLIPSESGKLLFGQLARFRPQKNSFMFSPEGLGMGQSSGGPPPMWVQNLVYTPQGKRCISNVLQTSISYVIDGLGLIPGVNCVVPFTLGQVANNLKQDIGMTLDSTYIPPSPMAQSLGLGLDAAGCIPIVGQWKAVGDATKDTLFLTYQLIDCGSVALTGKDIAGALIGNGGLGGRLAGQFFGSFDPNNKFGTPGYGSLGYITTSQPINYSIEFQNSPTATASAQVVNVIDAADNTALDFSSIVFGSVVVGTHVYTPPANASSINTTIDLRPDVNLLVQVQTNISNPAPGLGSLGWTFTSIDPATGMPLASGDTRGFLPADTTSPIGEANISFSAKFLPGLATYRSVTNSANIQFDTNPGIITPTWANVIDADAPVSSVGPLPAIAAATSFPVTWSGTDVGSGIVSYTIYVSQDGAPFTVWLLNVASTSGTYQGQAGSTYGFFSVAQDGAGNNEAVKAAADVTTMIPAGASPAVTLSGTMLSFAAQSINTPSVPQSVMLTNTGTGPLNISSIAASGGNAADYTPSSNCGPSVLPTKSCTVQVTFSPAALGVSASTLMITDNVAGSPQLISLSGFGIPATLLSLSANNLMFGSFAVGTPSPSQMVTLTNMTSSLVTLNNINVTGANPTDFVPAYSCGPTLAASGGSCVVTVTFTPGAPGSRAANLVFTDSATGSPQSVGLSGTGLQTSQTITFAPLPNVTYGVAPISLGAKASSGLPITYTVTGPATISGSTLTVTGAGLVTVTASQSGNTNYSGATSVQQSSTVNQATLTATAVSTSRVYGAANPAFTYMLSGFVNGDSTAVVTGTPVESTTANSTSVPGMYPITITQGTLAAANYAFTFVNGTLTVNGGAAQTITFSALPNVVYGVAPISLNASASSGLPMSYSVKGPATISGSTLTVTGAGMVTVTASQAGNGDYAAATSVPQSFSVTAATLTVTANNASRAVGAANPVFSYMVTGFVNSDTASVVGGTATLTTTANATSIAGMYPITFATEALTATNYSFHYVSGVLTVTAVVLQPAATPTFLPTPGTYTSPQMVKILDDTPGVEIFYTVDNSTPSTTTSPRYTVPIAVNGNETIKAIAINPGVTLQSAVAVGAYIIQSSPACSIDYSTGFKAAGLSLNNGAKILNGALQLTDGQPSEARSAFSTTLMPMSNFTTDFTFQLSQAHADGFTFTVQTIDPRAVGLNGGGLGYAGIFLSAAVKFDIYNNFGEGNDSTGLYIEGFYPAIPAINLAPSGVQLNSGHIMHAHVVYLNQSLTLTLQDTQTHASFSKTWSINLPRIVNSNYGFVGFTGGTGAETAVQNVLTWSVNAQGACGAKK